MKIPGNADWHSCSPLSQSKQTKVVQSQKVVLLATFQIWLSLTLMSFAHIKKFASRGKKYPTCLILSSQPCEENFLPKFCRTREETAEQNVFCMQTISFCVQVILLRVNFACSVTKNEMRLKTEYFLQQTVQEVSVIFVKMGGCGLIVSAA